MGRVRGVVCVLVGVVLWAGMMTGAQAQEVYGALDARETLATARVELGPTPQLGVGVARGVSVWDVPVSLEVSATLPVVLLDVGAHALEIGARAPLWRSGAWLLDGRLGVHERRAPGPLSTVHALGWRGTVRAGWSRSGRWFAAAEVGASGAALMHMRHTDAYQAEVSGVQSGWYRGAGGMFTLGAQGGWYASRRVLISARVGWNRTLALEAPMFFPWTMGLGAGWRF